MGGATMQTDRLLSALFKKVLSHDSLPWLAGYLSCSSVSGESYTESSPPEGDIDAKQIGPWLLVTASINYDGATDGPTTDRAGGDPYSAQVRYDWIGPADSAPHEVTSPEELNAWALFSTFHVREYNDVGIWGVQEGSWVESLSEDGTVTIREANGRFQDELPESKSTLREVVLKMPHALNKERT
jgi:hypothetical protein